MVIVTCFLFVVLSRTAARFCTQLAPLPFQNDLLQKTEVFANLALKKTPSNNHLSYILLNILGPLHISLLCALPQLEELGTGRDED